MATPTFNGWQDIARHSATGLADAANGPATTYQAPSLSPYVKTDAVKMANVGAITSGGALQDRQAFANPYTQDVINTTLSGYDQDAGMRQAAQQAAGARNGAFGGSRFGVAEGMLGGQLALGRGQLQAGLSSDAWKWSLEQALGMQGQNQQTALSQATTNAQLAQQAALANSGNANAFAMRQAELQSQQGLTNAQLAEAAKARQLQSLALLGDTANSVAGNDRADLSLIADLGAQERAIAQQQAQAQLAQLQAEGAMMGNIPVGNYTGQTVDATSNGTQTQSGGLLGSILGGLAGGIGSIM